MNSAANIKNAFRCWRLYKQISKKNNKNSNAQPLICRQNSKKYKNKKEKLLDWKKS